VIVFVYLVLILSLSLIINVFQALLPRALGYIIEQKNYTYYLVWKVINNTYYYPRLTNTTEYYSKLYNGIYVDINNGSIVGEFLYSPTKTVQSYQNNITGVAGIFSLFPLSIYNSTVQKLPSGYNSTVLLQFNPNYLLIEMVFIVTVIIVIVAFIIFRYLMHHK
jgi:hypothetical protein